MCPGDLSPQTILLGSGAAFRKTGFRPRGSKWLRGAAMRRSRHFDRAFPVLPRWRLGGMKRSANAVIMMVDQRVFGRGRQGRNKPTEGLTPWSGVRRSRPRLLTNKVICWWREAVGLGPRGERREEIGGLVRRALAV
jgi:hypothetical protein